MAGLAVTAIGTAVGTVSNGQAPQPNKKNEGDNTNISDELSSVHSLPQNPNESNEFNNSFNSRSVESITGVNNIHESEEGLNPSPRVSVSQINHEKILAQTHDLIKKLEEEIAPENFDKDSSIQGLKNLGAKITHDLYDAWAEFEKQGVKEAQEIRQKIANIFPKDFFNEIDQGNFEVQQQAISEIHEKIDDFFSTDLATSYSPEAKTKDNIAYAVCPPPHEGFFGKKGWELENSAIQPTRNLAKKINDLNYRAHALDQMQNRGILPSMVENAIYNGEIVLNNNGVTHYYDPINKIKVLLNEKNEVITAYFTN